MTMSILMMAFAFAEQLFNDDSDLQHHYNHHHHLLITRNRLQTIVIIICLSVALATLLAATIFVTWLRCRRRHKYVTTSNTDDADKNPVNLFNLDHGRSPKQVNLALTELSREGVTKNLKSIDTRSSSPEAQALLFQETSVTLRDHLRNGGLTMELDPFLTSDPIKFTANQAEGWTRRSVDKVTSQVFGSPHIFRAGTVEENHYTNLGELRSSKVSAVHRRGESLHDLLHPYPNISSLPSNSNINTYNINNNKNNYSNINNNNNFSSNNRNSCYYYKHNYDLTEVHSEKYFNYQ